MQNIALSLKLAFSNIDFLPHPFDTKPLDDELMQQS